MNGMTFSPEQERVITHYLQGKLTLPEAAALYPTGPSKGIDPVEMIEKQLAHEYWKDSVKEVTMLRVNGFGFTYWERNKILEMQKQGWVLSTIDTFRWRRGCRLRFIRKLT